jgi:hypothetical protein
MEVTIMKRPILLAGTIAMLLSVPSALCFAQRPTNAFQFRIGGMMLEHDGDLWRDTEKVFTIVDDSQFEEVIVGFSFVTAPSNYFEIGLNADLYDASFFSRYREYLDEFGYPIFHDMHLTMVPLTVDFRFLPGGRYRIRHGGRQVRKPVVYIGAGGGINLWNYEEIGEFIDFDDEDWPIFFDQFEDSGAAFETHVMAGLELPVAPRFNLVFEGRYSWSEDTMGEDFADFGDIDLSGAMASVGGSFRF